MGKHYVDNKEFYAEMIRYTDKCKENAAKGLERPKVPEYVGLCIYQIATKLASKPNFSGYTYKDEMIGDGIETCIKYVHNFDPEKSTNPFAYFTQIIYFSFLQRIQKEKKQTYIKHKTMQNSYIMNELVDSGMDSSGEHFDSILAVMDYDNMADLEKKFAKKVKKPAVSLDEETDEAE